jgi:hypothetical protein
MRLFYLKITNTNIILKTGIRVSFGFLNFDHKYFLINFIREF